jgi:transcriptional regulator with GAF, ATPase, and Fis domain
MDPQTRVARLERLLALNKRLLEEEEVGHLLDLALESVVEFADADRGFILLREADGNVRVKAAQNIDRETVRSDRFRPSRAIADRVLSAGEAVVSNNALDDDRFLASESLHEMAIKSVMAIPIRTREHVLGAVYLDRMTSGRPGFNADDLRLLQDFGDVAAIAVEMRRLVERLEVQGEELRKAKASLERLTATLQDDVAAKSVEIARVERDLEAKNRALGLKYTFGNIVGRSPRMHRIFDTLSQVMDYPVPVLITGESGTGKELIARALHHGGPRKVQPFMAINCAAIPENLLESELFGFKRGAFTGATADKEGLFRAARAGTVFLDEIGEMPLSVQSKLLRVLQEKEVRPIGGRDSEKVEARIVAATNRELRREIAAGRFREDLFYRLNVVEVHVPPLRERLEDIAALVDHFLEQVSSEFGLPPRRLSPDALQALLRFDWPGNVRQLENSVKSSAILSRGAIVSADELRLPTSDRGEPAPSRVEPVRVVAEEVAPPAPARGIRTRADWEGAERQRILDALVECNWNKSKAAVLLSVSRRNLYRKLTRYGIEGGTD